MRTCCNLPWQPRFHHQGQLPSNAFLAKNGGKIIPPLCAGDMRGERAAAVLTLLRFRRHFADTWWDIKPQTGKCFFFFLEVFHFFPPPVLFPSVVKKWTPPHQPSVHLPVLAAQAWLYHCQRRVYTLWTSILTFFFLVCFNETKRRAIWQERVYYFFYDCVVWRRTFFWLTCHLVPFQMDWSGFFCFFNWTSFKISRKPRQSGRY